MNFNNLELADELIALILSECLKTFPCPYDIDWRCLALNLSKKYEVENISEIDTQNLNDGKPPILLMSSKPSVRITGDKREINDVIYSLLLWLDQEEFIRYKPNFIVKYDGGGNPYLNNYGYPSEVVPTAKTMKILKLTPYNLTDSENLLEKFKSYALSTGKTVSDNAASELVSKLFDIAS